MGAWMDGWKDVWLVGWLVVPDKVVDEFDVSGVFIRTTLTI